MPGRGVVFSVILAVVGILCVAGGLTMIYVMPGVIHNGVIQVFGIMGFVANFWGSA